MRSLVRTIEVMWYCSNRPITWMGVLARVRRRIARWILSSAGTRTRSAEERTAAVDWCAERSLRLEELSDALPFDFTVENLGISFPQELEAANDVMDVCPVRFGGAGHIDLLHSLARAIEARRVVETGVAFGWSSLALLLAIKDGGDKATLWSVDFPYFSEWDTRWIGAAVPRNVRSHWHLIRAADRQGLPVALRHCIPVDLAHYDSDKTARGRFFGYWRMWKALRNGGVLVSDDVGDNLAFKSFAEQVGRTAVVVARDGKYQGILVK